MRTLILFAALSIGLTLVTYGQQGNTVTKSYLFQIPVGGTVRVGPLPNIGQTSHIMTWEFVQAANHALACNPYFNTALVNFDPGFNLVISGDNVTDLIRPPLNPIPSGLFTGSWNIRSWYGTGAGPFLYLETTSINANCAVSVYYTGSTNSIAPIPYYRAPSGNVSDLAFAGPKWVTADCNGSNIPIYGPNTGTNGKIGVASILVKGGALDSSVTLFTVDRAGAAAISLPIFSPASATFQTAPSLVPIMTTFEGQRILCTSGTPTTISVSLLVFQF